MIESILNALTSNQTDADQRRSLHRVLGFLALLGVVQFAAWLVFTPSNSPPFPYYLTWHTSLELTSVAISTMVFLVGWLSYANRDNSRTVTYIALIFLAVAVLDFFHAMAYQGMPDYFSANVGSKHLHFWMAARFLAAAGLLLVIASHGKKSLSNRARYRLLFLLLGGLAAYNWLVVAHHEILPALFVTGKGLTPLKINLEYLYIAISLATMITLILKPSSWGLTRVAPLLIGATGAMAMSELYFTFYTTMVGYHNFLGHVYKIIGDLFILRALVAVAIEHPYLQLAESRTALDVTLKASNTILWSWHIKQDRLSHHIPDGASPHPAVQPAHAEAWFELIHPDDRERLKKAVHAFIDNEAPVLEIDYRRRIPGSVADDYRWIMTRAEKLRDVQGQTTQLIGSYTDITERHRAEERFRAALSAAPNAMIMVDMQGRIILTNRQANVMFGYAEDALLGQSLDILLPEPARHNHGSLVQRFFQQPSERTMAPGRILHARRADGQTFRVEIRLVPIKAETHQYALASIVDITERLESDQRIQQLIHFDPLTLLPNRNLLADRVRQTINLAAREQKKFALLFIDLDRFKNVNDTLGHPVGDKLLIEVAKRLTDNLRESDTVARVGGDEFVAICYGIQEDSLIQLTGKLLHSLSQPCLIDGHEVLVSASVGIAVYPDDGNQFEILYQHADTAMYHVKQDGRNDFRFFTADMRTRALRLMTLQNALNHALEKNQFQLHYQPQLSTDDGKVIGCEALLRWNHPELGNVSPGEFIPLAESTGQIVPIGAWVLRTALHQLKQWLDAGLPEMLLAVNLSAAQFRDQDLPELVRSLLAETGVPPHCLELELTESAAMIDPASSIYIITTLRAQGIALSIDDFGTGYSSLSYLKKFRISKLKIDQSFVRDIVTDADDRAIVRTIIQMAESLGFKTIAEGVETEAQRDFLREQGCQELQGYLFSRPLPADRFEEYLRNSLK